MKQIQNYIPNEVLFAFSSTAFIKIDETENDGVPTVNLVMCAGEKEPGRSGVSTDNSVDSINIQLDIFELVNLTAVFLGHQSQIKISRKNKTVEIKRQTDALGTVSCYAVGIVSNLKLQVSITSGRIFCASMLCMSRLQKMHPNIPVQALMDGLAGTGLTGKETARTEKDDKVIQARPVHFEHREIPNIDSRDPARSMPKHRLS